MTLFAAIADILKPTSFAGLFGAAPSVALTTLVLTFNMKGPAYCALEGRSMIGGAIAFLIYAISASVLMGRWRIRAQKTALLAMPVWAMMAAIVYFLGLRR